MFFSVDDVLLRSRDNRDQVAMLCEIARNFDVLGRQISGEGSPKFLTEFYKSGSPMTKFGDDRPSDLEIRRRKKRIKKERSKRQR